MSEPTGSSSPTGMPRWVKVFLLILVVLIAAFVVLRLTGVGGEHGPGRHMPAGLGGTPSAGVAAHLAPMT